MASRAGPRLLLAALALSAVVSSVTAAALDPRVTLQRPQAGGRLKPSTLARNHVSNAFDSVDGRVNPSTSLAMGTHGGGVASTNKPRSKSFSEMAQVGSYFVLWYLFNIGYNICNKQALNVVDYPWTVATLQMATGMAYFVPLWILGLRKAPKLAPDEVEMLVPIALCHTAVHVGAVIALGAGAVSFAHIVRSSEPAVACLLNNMFTGTVLPDYVMMTLVPIVGGVAMASVKDVTFTILTFVSAMLSNFSSSARVVLSKKVIGDDTVGENLDAQNLYAVLTMISTVILLPLMLALEGTGFFKAFKDAVAADDDFTTKSLATLLAAGGATYYAYNEVSFLVLDRVNPVSHAIGNTIKRIIIIVASVLAFKTPTSTGAIIGCCIAIAGTLMYALSMDAWAKSAPTARISSRAKKVVPTRKKQEPASGNAAGAIIGSGVAIGSAALMGSAAMNAAENKEPSSSSRRAPSSRKLKVGEDEPERRRGSTLAYVVGAASALFASFG